MAKTPRTETKGSSNGSDTDTTQRSVLPIPDVTPIGLTTFDAKDPDTKYPPIRPVRPPAGAPNVLVVLIDDAGFGSCRRLAALAARRISRSWRRVA
jgi:hypothetical protein